MGNHNDKIIKNEGHSVYQNFVLKDINSIVRYQLNSTKNESRTEKQFELLALTEYERIKKEYLENKYNFKKNKVKQVRINEKFKKIYNYEPMSTELILCIHIKRSLDRSFKIRYQNRNMICKQLFSKIDGILHLMDFTIVRFDFKDYFNSISTGYVFEKYIKHKNINRIDLELISNFVEKCEYCYPGINTSNVFAEIISQHFDDLLRQKLSNKGLIFYKRFVDDGIIIFKNKVDSDIIKSIINECIEIIYRDSSVSNNMMCTSKLNEDKYNCITKSNLKQSDIMDYLGYRFEFEKDKNNKVKVKYGITDAKISKYRAKLDKIAKEAVDDTSACTQQKINVFCSRIVYMRRSYDKVEKKYNNNTWIAKGFVTNYNELRHKLDSLDSNTKEFLEDAIYESFSGVDNISYFLNKNDSKSQYSLYKSLEKNRSMIFMDHYKFGYDRKTLIEMYNSVIKSTDDKLDSDDNSKSYNFITSKYLINTGIGY